MKRLHPDVLVIGAGFSGAVMAERFASQSGKVVEVIEQREHIGGNCFDFKNQHNITVHKYGPHLFHTSKKHVWEYLSQFTEWHPYVHKVLTRVDGLEVPLPFNLNTLQLLYSPSKALEIEQILVNCYGANSRVPILQLMESEEPLLKQLANTIYEKFFVNYTAKQWGCDPSEIAPEVTARVPVVISRDDRYFQDPYQAIPASGYSALITNMLSHPNVTVHLSTSLHSRVHLDHESKSIFLDGKLFKGMLIYTGMLDHLFDFTYGELPYRSLQFEFETLKQPWYQNATTVNSPNENAYTRITEFKHILAEESESTTIVKEYPQDYDRHDETKNVPYYPVFNDNNSASHAKYIALTKAFKNLCVLGRLAEYKYFNMDDAIDSALSKFAELQSGVNG